MKQTLVAALIVAVSIPGVWSADTKGNAADEAAIRAAVAGYNDARNAVNAKAMAEFYTADAQQLGNRGHVSAEGRAALEKYFATWSQDPRYKGMRASREVTNIRFYSV